MKRLVNFEMPPPTASPPQGFEPAFLDTGTLAIYRSRHGDGRGASIHLLDGLPDEVVWSRGPDGRVRVPKPTLVAGYVRGGFFYTPAAARRAAAEWGLI
jgi:hypothetical protein